MNLVLVEAAKNTKSAVEKIYKSRIIYSVLFLTVSLIGLFGYGLVNARQKPQINEVIFEHQDIPKAFDGKKIAFLSDLHYDLGKNLVREAIDQINEMKPDYLLLGGDLIDEDPDKIEELVSELDRIDDSIPTYIVYGNHDNTNKIRAKLRQAIKAQNRFTVINNSGLWLMMNGDRIRLGGVGSYSNDIQMIDRAVGDAQKSDFVILAAHEPDYFEEIDKTKLDLVLSGHLHGGQVTIFNLWHPLVPTKYFDKYMNRQIVDGGASMIISSGLGTTLAPVRIGSRPEMLLITLKAVNKN